MGADFLFAIAIQPTDRDVAAMEAAIKRLTEDDCDESDIDVHGSLDGFRAHLTHCVQTVADGDQSRDVSSIKLGDHFLFISGGMSWGDSPSEFCDAVWDLERAGLLLPDWDDFEFKRKAVDPTLVEQARAFLSKFID